MVSRMAWVSTVVEPSEEGGGQSPLLPARLVAMGDPEPRSLEAAGHTGLVAEGGVVGAAR